MSELPIDAIKQLFIKTDCDCEEECYCDNNHTVIKLAEAQLQALLDEIERLTVDRDFWRQTAVDMEQSVQFGIRDNEKVGYVLCAAIRGFNDAIDARQGDKQ